jgi:hypothetical protein
MQSSPQPDVGAALDAAVHEYRQRGDVGALLDRVKAVVREAPTEALGPAAAPYMDLPEVVIPVYERIVELSPTEAQPMVVLANAYWLSGRGAEVVGQLAERAKSVDDGTAAPGTCGRSPSPTRAANGAMACGDAALPGRPARAAALADNAASVAGAEHDPLALDLAVQTFESLWAEASRDEERRALEETIAKLKGWTL